MCNEYFCLDAVACLSDTYFVSKNIFFIGLILAASGLVSPPVALACGLIYGFSFLHPFHVEATKLSKLLLQASVVGLGFGMDLQQVIKAGRSGFIYTAGSISFALLLGWGLGKLLQVKQRISYLISSGTAICGGSAIAAIAPITNASQEEIAVSLGTVFVLNAVALLTFPAIGTVLHMTQTQFGLWSGLAIHDISSVVGATAKYGAVALAVGTPLSSPVLYGSSRFLLEPQWQTRARRVSNGHGSFSSSASLRSPIPTSISFRQPIQ